MGISDTPSPGEPNRLQKTRRTNGGGGGWDDMPAKPSNLPTYTATHSQLQANYANDLSHSQQQIHRLHTSYVYISNMQQ